MPYNNNAGVWGVVMENAKYRELLKGLNAKEKKIAKLYFGIGESAKLSAGEIAEKLSYSYGYVDFVIENLEDKLDMLHFYSISKDSEKKSKKTSNKSKKMDAFYMVEKVDEATSKLIDKMSDAFFKMFPNEEPLVVEHSLKLLPKKDRNIVFLYYGLDGIHCMDYDEIAEKYKMSIDSVDKSLETSIRTLKRNFSEGKVGSARTEWKENKYSLLVKRYGKTKVEEAMSLFSKQKQEMVKEYYMEESATSKKIAEKHGISTSTAYNLIIDTVEKIDNILKDNSLPKSEGLFFSKFPDATKDQIISAFSLLDEQKQTIVRLYYGIGTESLPIQEIAKKYYVGNEKIIDIIEETIRKTSKKIELFSNANTNIFYKKFKGFSKDQINNVLSKLTIEEKDVISSYYGLNGTKLTIEQICKKYNYNVSSMHSLIGKIRTNIKRMLENPEIILKTTMPVRNKQIIEESKLDKIYQKHETLVSKYGIEKVKESLVILSTENSLLIKEFLGIEMEKKTLKSISFIKGIKEEKIANAIADNLDEIEKFLDSYKASRSKSKRESNKYYELVFKYGLESVEKAFSLLKDDNQELIRLCCGLGCEKLSQTEIAKKYNTSTANISARISRSIAKIEEYIKNPPLPKEKKETKSKKGKKVNKYEELISKYGQEKVGEEFSKLSDTNQKILKMYYGINGVEMSLKEIAEEVNSNEKAVYARISLVIKRLINNIENPVEERDVVIKKKNNKYDILIEKYGEDKVKESFESLTGKYRECVSLYYGIENQALSQKEIAAKLNVSANYVSVCVVKGIQKMADFIENPEIKEDMKEKFYAYFEGYSKEQIDEAKSVLKERDLGVIYDYYLSENNLSMTEICEKYDISHSGFYVITKRSLSSILKELKEPGTVKKSTRGKNFYENFEGYTKEQVKEAFLKLSEDDQELISLLYGLGEIKLTSKQIAEKKGISTAYLYNKVGKKIKLIKELLVNPNVLDKPVKIEKEKTISKKKNNDNLLYEYIVNEDQDAFDELIDINMESVIKVVNNYISNREVVESYDELLTLGTIGLIKAIKSFDKENLGKKSLLTVARTYIVNELNSQTGKKDENVIFFDDKIEVGNKKVKVKSTLIDDTFEETIIEEEYNNYKSKKVNQALESLGENERKTIELYYGLNGHKRHSQSDIAKIMGVSPVTVSRVLKESHSELLFELREFKTDYPINEEINKTIENRLNKEAIAKQMKQAFFSLFKDKNKDEVLSLLNSLPARKKNIISLYYGLKDECLNYDEIAEKYKVSVEEVIEVIEEIINQLRGLGMPKDEGRDSNFKKLISKYSKTIVKDSIGELSESEKAFLVMYYTLGNGETYTLPEISKIIGVDEDKLILLEKKILEKLEITMSSKEKISIKRKEFFAKFTDKKELKRVLKTLNEKELTIISLYYGLNGKEILTKEELCKKFRVKESEFEKVIEEIIAKININISSTKR